MPSRSAAASLFAGVIIWILGGPLAMAEGQFIPIPGTQVHTFVSAFTGRDYELRIGLPRNYDPTNRRYTVVYQLDGQWDFDRTWAITRAMEFDGRLEPMIVCGITYAGDNPNYGALRTRDYTPIDVYGGGASGDADKFLRTLVSEIIPLVQSTYACRKEERVLMGSSFGGLFTAYTLLHNPGSFTGYVLSSPSIWFGGQTLVSQVAAARSGMDGRSLRARIITGALESYSQRQGATEFYNALQLQNLPGLDLTLAFEPQEYHGAVAEMAYLRGLPEVLQPKLVPLSQGDDQPRTWQEKTPRLGWWVDDASTTIDAITGARRRYVVKDPSSPSRATYVTSAIYVLNGQWDARIVDAHYGALIYDGQAAPNILRVGVDWDADRTSELMAWREQDFRPNDPAGAYRTWLRDVVLPGAESHLTSAPSYRMVIASEKAAQWALADLLSESPSFDRYLLVSPDVVSGERWLFQAEAARAARGGDLKARVMIYNGGGESGTSVREPVADWVQQLKSRAYPGLKVEHIELPEVGYAQAKYEGYHKGLRLLVR